MSRPDARALAPFLKPSGARLLVSLPHPDRWGRCRLNKGMTAEQARQVFQGACADVADDQPLRQLIASNILREWGSPQNLVIVAQAGGFVELGA